MSMESYQNTVCKPAFTTVRRYSKIKYVQKGLWTPGAVLHLDDLNRCVNGTHEGKAVEKQLVYMETSAQSG